MKKLTIVYIDGYQEQYNVVEPSNGVDSAMGLKRYKDIIADGMLKLFVENNQLILIPLTSIRKIISTGSGLAEMKIEEYPGFINAKIADGYLQPVDSSETIKNNSHLIISADNE